jgi:putative DNA primase/helicase
MSLETTSTTLSGLLDRVKTPSRTEQPPADYAIPEGLLDEEELDEEEQVADKTQEFAELCFRELFEEGLGWISCAGTSYRWEQDHYEERTDSQMRRMVSAFAREYRVPQYNDAGEITSTLMPFTGAHFVSRALGWFADNTGIEPEQLNQSGLINCTNGVVRIVWRSGLPTPMLEPHDPQRHFLIDPPSTYFNPQAPAEECLRFLGCIKPDALPLWLEVMGTALDVSGYREHVGSRVPGLLQYGHGNNGKDALNLAMARLLGTSTVANVGLNDWRQYDKGEGRGRFAVSQLIRAKISMSPETSSFIKLDELQGLKAAITGDPLFVEDKGAKGFSFRPQCVFVWNLNRMVLMDASQQAITSRYAVIPFPYEFTDQQEVLPGQMRAEPRFKNDAHWLRNNVLPALLNLLIDGLQRAARDGFSRDAVAEDMQQARRDSSHLWSFAEEIGLAADEQAEPIELQDLWVELARWYQRHGWLRSGSIVSGDLKHLSLYFADSDDTDKPIKASRDLFKRLRQLFPKISKGQHPRTRTTLIYGLARSAPEQAAKAREGRTSAA